MTNNNRLFNICKEHLLGYTVDTINSSYDDTLDYVEVNVKFYLKHEISNENVDIMESYTDSMICDAIVEKMGFLNEIDPYGLSWQLRNEDEK
jgi:hypothetical protein